MMASLSLPARTPHSAAVGTLWGWSAWDHPNECLLPPPPSSQDLVSPPPPAFRPPQNPQNAIVLFQWQVSLLPPLFNFGQQTGFWGQLTSCWAGAPAPYHTAAKVWHSYDEVIIRGKSYSIQPTLEPWKVTITVVPQELNELSFGWENSFRHIGGSSRKRTTRRWDIPPQDLKVSEFMTNRSSRAN